MGNSAFLPNADVVFVNPSIKSGDILGTLRRSSPSFDIKNPNKLRSVLGTFQRENISLFHSNDGSGYKFISEQIAIIDKKNPQAAARLVIPLTRYNNYNYKRKEKMKKALKDIYNKNVSNDLLEIIDKALN